MSKQWKPGKPTVELQPSRIRRNPVQAEKEIIWRSREWEVRLAMIGVVLFAIAITLLSIGVSAVTI